MGANKTSKEFKLHTTHDASVKRKYNTSVKTQKHVEISEYAQNDNSTGTGTSRSVRSFNFSNGHQPLIEDGNSEKTSPFRSVKWRR